MLTKKRRYKNQTMRRAVRTGPGTSNMKPPATPIVPVFVHVGSTLTVTFPEPAVYSGILPNYTNNARTVTAVSITSPTTATITFNGTTAATATVVPFQDPAFRNMAGGYVQPGSYTTT